MLRASAICYALLRRLAPDHDVVRGAVHAHKAAVLRNLREKEVAVIACDSYPHSAFSSFGLQRRYGDTPGA